MDIMKCDCLDYCKKIDNNFFDLIYLDPPFFTQDIMKSSDNEYSFNDKWDSLEDYINYMKIRLTEFKRILKDTGSIFLHCDKKASHYLKVAMDEIFGKQNFQSEIVWFYKRWSNSKKGLLNSHQIILFYSKTNKFKFNKILVDYSPTTNIDQILQSRKRDENGKTTYKTDVDGNVEIATKKDGVPMGDVWEIPFLNPKAKERVNYPTQKPLELLERIIKISTDKGDKVYDPFCGSGTTLVAAKILDRDFYGTDISEDAIELTNARISNPLKTESVLLKKGYKSYINQDSDKINILNSLNAKIVQRNKSIDGIIQSKKYKFVPIKISLENDISDDIEKLALATKKKGLSYAILITSIRNQDKCGVLNINDVTIRIHLLFNELLK